MEIHVEITRKDYADFSRYYFIKKGLKHGIVIVVIVSLLLPLTNIFDKPFSFSAYALNVLVDFVLWGIIYFAGVIILISLLGHIPAQNASILGLKKYTITEQGFALDSELHQGFHKWEGIRSVRISKKSIFLFTDRATAYIIPRRYFENREKENEFLLEIKKRMHIE